MAKSQRGNILFLILLAVVLFAALSYAVTSSMRGGGNDASSENSKAAAATMIQFMSTIETFITRAKLVDSVPDNGFTFQVDSNTTSLVNYNLAAGGANCWNLNANCTRAACRVFQPFNPNGIPALRFENYADPLAAGSSQAKGGHLQFNQVIIPNVGTSAPELLGVVMSLQADICNAINAQQGITTNYTTATTIEDIGETATTSRPTNMASTCGSNAVFDTTRVFGEEATQFAGKTFFCAPVINSGNGTGSKLALVYVLIPR